MDGIGIRVYLTPPESESQYQWRAEMSNTISSKIDDDVLPSALTDRTQWLCWRSEKRGGKQTKIPVDPETGDFASSTDDRTWSDLETALAYVDSANADGIGFVFTSTDPIVGVDLDKCRDPETGRPDEDAKAIIQRLDSFTEISPSGTGYHVLIQGELPSGRNRRGGIEMYDQSRFFTVTADHVDGTPTSINDRKAELETIHEEFVAEEDSDEDDAVDVDRSETAKQDQTIELEDETLLKRARSASNGAKFDRLWRGNIQGYDSQSEADMALCCLLAFWTGGDRMKIDRLFRQSGLIRGKWDDIHHADGSTYGEKTIERAIGMTGEFYEPQAAAVDTSADTDSETGSETSSPAGIEQTYLEEKNRLLEQRVDELEQIITDHRDEIEQLTAERQELRSIVEKQEEAIEQYATQANEIDASSPSLWARVQQLWSRG